LLCYISLLILIIYSFYDYTENFDIKYTSSTSSEYTNEMKVNLELNLLYTPIIVNLLKINQTTGDTIPENIYDIYFVLEY
jgi:hypothetical protein